MFQLKKVLFAISIIASLNMKAQNCNCKCLMQKANEQFENPNLDTLFSLGNRLDEFVCDNDKDYKIYEATLLGAIKQVFDNDKSKANYILEKILIPSFWYYNDSVALIKNREGKYGYIDKKLNVVIPCKYEAAANFVVSVKKFPEVMRNGKEYLIDIEGHEYPLVKNLKDLTFETEALDLRNQNLTSLPDSICKFRNLKILILQNNKIEYLPKDFAQLTQLIKLLMDKNLLKAFPDNFGDLKKLKFLDISGCKVERLPSSFSQLSALENCQFHTNPLINLPEDFGQLKNLKELNLYCITLEKLPESFSKLKNLEWLTLSGSKIKELPTNFYKLINLKSLGLSSNLEKLPKKFDKGICKK
jgi:Leucine rich repeat